MNLTRFVRAHKARLLIAASVIALAVWFIIANRENLSREAIMAYGESLPRAWLVLAFVLLPMLGFPISVLLVLLGIRFGLLHGILVCAGGMVFHHLAGYFSVHGTLRPWIHHKMKSWGYEIPKIGGRNPVWFTILFAAIHGPPYTLKIYLLALTEVPFRIYFWAGLPVYLAFSITAIAAGAALMTFDPTLVYVLIGAITVLAIATSLLRKRTARE